MKSLCLSVLLLSSTMSLAASDVTLSTVNDIYARRTAAIAAANKAALEALKPLTKTAKGEVLNEVWRGIKEIDPQNEEATKFLANVPATGVLSLNDPNTTINEAKAQILEKLTKAGKYTGKDWDAFPGQPIVVKGEGRVIKKVKKGNVYIVVPNPEDKWKERADKPLNSYKGEKGQMQLIINLIPNGVKETVTFPVVTKCLFKVDEDATFSLTAVYGNAQSIGEMRVKVYEVIP